MSDGEYRIPLSSLCLRDSVFNFTVVVNVDLETSPLSEFGVNQIRCEVDMGWLRSLEWIREMWRRL